MKLPMLRSRQLLAGPAGAPARAMVRAVGLNDEDFERPLIGIANTWTDTTRRSRAAWAEQQPYEFPKASALELLNAGGNRH